MEDHLNTLLASKLYTLRRQANLKQSDLAQKLRISQQAYSKLESGVTKFNARIIETLCQCFHMSQREFLDLDASKNAQQPGQAFDQMELPPCEKHPSHMFLLMEELKKMREERKILMEFMANQVLEHKYEREILLGQIRKMLENEECSPHERINASNRQSTL